jgi:hypothetical protein
MSDYDPPSPIRASQLDPEEAERLMMESEVFTEQSEFDNEDDWNMLKQGKYDEYINNKLSGLNNSSDQFSNHAGNTRNNEVEKPYDFSLFINFV